MRDRSSAANGQHEQHVILAGPHAQRPGNRQQQHEERLEENGNGEDVAAGEQGIAGFAFAE